MIDEGKGEQNMLRPLHKTQRTYGRLAGRDAQGQEEPGGLRSGGRDWKDPGLASLGIRGVWGLEGPEIRKTRG